MGAPSSAAPSSTPPPPRSAAAPSARRPPSACRVCAPRPSAPAGSRAPAARPSAASRPRGRRPALGAVHSSSGRAPPHRAHRRPAGRELGASTMFCSGIGAVVRYGPRVLSTGTGREQLPAHLLTQAIRFETPCFPLAKSGSLWSSTSQAGHTHTWPPAPATKWATSLRWPLLSPPPLDQLGCPPSRRRSSSSAVGSPGGGVAPSAESPSAITDDMYGRVGSSCRA